jgi:D-glycero-D-manno-heptose 1,7-bisphosphate phosphatase
MDRVILYHDKSNYPLNIDGVWIEVRHVALATPGPVLFLDRDGVINEDRHYVGDPEEVALMPGASELIREANNNSVPVAVITNQSAIDRKMFGWRDFAAVMARIDELLAVSGARIDAISACPFHPDVTPGFSARHAEWRKPGPRMIQELDMQLNADRARSWMIGDAASDMAAAETAGLAGGILIGNQISNTPGTKVVAVSSLDKIEMKGWLQQRSK